MACQQRPIPPPRRSKLVSKTSSCDAGDLELPSAKEISTLSDVLESESFDDKKNGNETAAVIRNDRFSLPASPTPLIHQEQPAQSISAQLDQPSMTTMDEQKTSRFCAVENPSYDSRTVPLRSRSIASSSAPRTTSNLIWFQSGVPVEFKMKSPDPAVFDQQKEDEVRQTPTQLAFSPLDESSTLPPPAPLYPAVASLYPKLPPSPILPRASFEYEPKEKVPNGLPSLEKPIEESTSSITNGQEAQGDRSVRSSIPASSLTESDLYEDEEEEERLRQSVESCKLTLNQPSIDGSMTSNTSEPLSGSVIDERWVPETVPPPPQPPPQLPVPATATGLDVAQRLRLAPVGANICNAGWLNKLGAKKKGKGHEDSLWYGPRGLWGGKPPGGVGDLDLCMDKSDSSDHLILDTVRRWCVLKNGTLELYADDTVSHTFGD